MGQGQHLPSKQVGLRLFWELHQVHLNLTHNVTSTMHGVTWLGPINRGFSLAMNVHAYIHMYTYKYTNANNGNIVNCVFIYIYHTLCELHVPQAPAFICVCFIVINPIQGPRPCLAQSWDRFFLCDSYKKYIFFNFTRCDSCFKKIVFF
jgi:hypothetical protein